MTKKLKKKNIIITGGQLFNKGAQAMVFTVVKELKNRFPDNAIYLFSYMDYKRPFEERGKYTFEILPWDLRLMLRRKKGLNLFIKNTNFSDGAEAKVKNVLNNTEFAVDISGYKLSSQFSLRRNVEFLVNIAAFKKYNINLFLLPQSLGPYNFESPGRYILLPLIKHYLSYPVQIFAREKQGLKDTLKLARANISQSVDIVLQSQEVKSSYVYEEVAYADIHKEHVYNKELEVRQDYHGNGNINSIINNIINKSVGIIPNSKLKVYNKNNNIINIYQKLIDYLLQQECKVYIIRHSYEDLSFCKEIKERYADENEVILIGDNLDAILLNIIISKMDYVIASRYHSLVHAYKNNRPAIIIGWAVKYFELSSLYKQSKYCFDIRSQVDIDQLLSTLGKLNKVYSKETKQIENKNIQIRKENVFNIIEEFIYKRRLQRGH